MSNRNRLYKAPLGGCLAAFLLAAPVLGQDAIEPQNRASQGQESGNTNEGKRPANGAEDAPVAKTPSLAEQPPSIEADGGQRAEEYQGPVYPSFQWDGLITTRDTSAQWLMALFGVVATVISAIAVYLIKKTLDATRDAVDQAEQATAVTREAFEETRLSNERQLRAYVHVKQIHFIRNDAEPNVIRCEIVIKNYGQTPAHKARIGAEIIWAHPDNQVRYTAYDELEIGWESSIAPSATSSLAPVIQVISPAWQDYILRKHGAFVNGKIWYEDVFGKERFTTFRVANNNPSVSSFFQVKGGNEAT